MPKIDITASAAHEPAAVRVEEQLKLARLAIEERAYHLAQERNNGGAGDAGNWFDAERQLFQVPPCELVEQNGHLRVRAAVPGFEAKQLRLTALPAAVLIESIDAANGADTNGANQGTVRFSEFNRNAVLRRVDLPDEIDLASVKAKLERGILEITAIKQGAKVKPVPARKTARTAKPKAPAAAEAKPATAPASTKDARKPKDLKPAGASPRKTTRTKKSK